MTPADIELPVVAPAWLVVRVVVAIVAAHLVGVAFAAWLFARPAR